MAKLIRVCREDEKADVFKDLQLPLFVEDMRAMVVQFENPVKLFNENMTSSPSSIPVTSSEKSCSRVLNYRQFTQKIDCFSDDCDLADSLTVKQEDFNVILSQLIPCVGCRNSMEKLYSDLATTNHSALLPFVVEKSLSISLHRSFLANRRALYKLLIVNGWDDIWPLMTEDCADECCVVETEHLLEMLESYLQKHKFCTDCRLKIMKAYHLLTGEADKTKEPGYNANLYQGLRYCSTECHLHLRPCTAYLNMLMDRAEPELLGGFKERHAKTLEIAQGEVLTCIGLYIYDRLHRLSMAMKTLQNTFQLLYCSGVAALSTAFQKSIETKSGLLDDSFEKICAELQESTVKPKSGKSKKSKSKIPNKQKKLEISELNFCRQCMKKSIDAKSQRRYHLSRSLSPIKRDGQQTAAASSCDTPRRCFDGEDDENEILAAAIIGVNRRPPTVNGDERFCSNKNCVFNTVDDQKTTTKTISKNIASSPGAGHSEDMGYLSSVTNHRKSTVSSDALSIESDRSEILDVLSESSPPMSSSKRFEGIFSAGSLTEMLRLSNETYSCTKDDDGIDSLDDETDESLAISKEDIEWFNRNRSTICQERQLLRAKLLEKFQNMQIRLSSSATASNFSAGRRLWRVDESSLCVQRTAVLAWHAWATKAPIGHLSSVNRSRRKTTYITKTAFFGGI
uniref:Gametogenetin-binding protein 2 n=1 Tax=Romanomermis culicivorax TaxID=13658 RepID=A0A915IHZ6_ROMCU